ncbi:hypothetical protein PRVXH_002447 [Proteinivorax hydrogeniformans]|uniref:Uncharacterized protein n=1 Tax=Proteinivorax hydrogeniformans TaxID=1826727 RepID=A0AAU8HSF6_9FIRM
MENKKLSKFNVYFEDNRGRILVFNTLTKAVCLFEKKEIVNLLHEKEVNDDNDLIIMDGCTDEDLLFEHFYNTKNLIVIN